VTSDEKPSVEEVSEAIKNHGFLASNVDIFYDDLY